MTVRTTWTRVLMLAAAVSVLCASAAFADQWNERTRIQVSDPVMVPGATLQPGTYIFRLVDSDANRHIVQVLTEDESKILTTTTAVPARRDDVRGDTVLKFNPSDRGVPAIKAWFYPGARFGHEFVYPDSQARDIANRTKTVVLSSDVEGTDMQKGTLYQYDAAGQRSTYTPDANLDRDWAAWHRQQSETATAGAQSRDRGAETGGSEANMNTRTTPSTSPAATARIEVPTKGSPESTAPVMVQQDHAIRVTLDDLEDNPTKYTGKTVTVSGQVEKVFGPRLFTIDEPHWMDVEGETLVYMPTNLAALVRDDDRVTVTGEVRRFARADVEREWGWPDTDAETLAALGDRPVLMASRIVGGDNNVALSISTATTGSAGTAERSTAAGEASGQAAQMPTESDSQRAVGTSGTSSTPDGRGPRVTDLATITHGDDDLVGRQVTLDRVRLTPAEADGYWLQSGTERLYVLPAGNLANLSGKTGQDVRIDGVVLQMPRSMRRQLDPGSAWNDDIYVYATSVK